MSSSCRTGSAVIAIAVCLLASPAAAQRAGENAAAAATDAFGTSVGNERVGLYSPNVARGFSPVQAGNVRIEGLYFDQQADLSERLVSGSMMRVGLSAQSYPFPAPTGIADFTLRKTGDAPVLSALAGFGYYASLKAELDGQLPISETLGVAGGAGFFNEEGYYGGSRRLLSAAIVPRWRPADNVEIIPFWSAFNSSGMEAQPIIFTAGAYLPPKIKRRDYFGQPWEKNDGTGVNYGAVSNFQFGAWAVRGGLFRSRYDADYSFTDLSLNTSADGVADRYVAVEADRRNMSVSGELRVSRQFDEGERRHIIHLAARGRDQERRYGGGQRLFIGRGPIDEVIETPPPDFTFGPQTEARVKQTTFGVGYEGRWRNVGELSLGLQKTDYKKEVDAPGAPLLVTRDEPWLVNATASIYASSGLVFYGGYTRGLEESPVAPDVAVNRGEAPPAIRTEQKDAGFRLALTDSLRLVAGLFDVRKPYFGLDNDRVFRNLGSVRHRGVELSLTGRVAPRLNAVIGAAFLDADLSGDAVDQGLVGPKPIGNYKRYVNATLDYQVPGVPGLSIDMNYENTSDRIADRLNTYVIPARYQISPGARYRFDIDGRAAMLRFVAGMATNKFGWVNIGEGFYYNPPRRVSLSLVTDV